MSSDGEGGGGFCACAHMYVISSIVVMCQGQWNQSSLSSHVLFRLIT